MNILPTLPLLALLSLLPNVGAQEFVLIARVGPGDLELNAELVRAVANEPEVEAALRQQAGAALQDWTGVDVSIPASHNAGTFQLHLVLGTSLRDAPSPAQAAALVDAARKHIEERIRFLFYEEPMTELAQRRADLSARLANLMAKEAACADQFAAADEEGARVIRASDLLEEQLAATKLALATEEQANVHLQKMAEEYQMERDRYRDRSTKAERDSMLLQSEVTRLKERLADSNVAAELADIEKRLMNLTTQAAKVEAERRDVAARALDVQQMLTTVFEQLPASTLALRRSRARLDSLEQQFAAHQKRCRIAAEQREKAFSARVDRESLAIEVDVCKHLLTEVQTQLARLHPVRFQVLRPQ